MKWGKYHEDLFPQHFGRKKSEIWIRGMKIDISWCDRFPTYRSTSQIEFKSSLNASNTSQIHRSSRKTTETMFFRSIFDEKYTKCGSGVRKSTYCDTTDFQPTAQQVRLCLNPFSLLLIHHKYIDQVGKPSRRCFPAAFWAKNIRNVDLGDEKRHTVMRPIPNLPLNRSNWD